MSFKAALSALLGAHCPVRSVHSRLASDAAQRRRVDPRVLLDRGVSVVVATSEAIPPFSSQFTSGNTLNLVLNYAYVREQCLLKMYFNFSPSLFF